MPALFHLDGKSLSIIYSCFSTLNRGQGIPEGFEKVRYELWLSEKECRAIAEPIYLEMKEDAKLYGDFETPSEIRLGELAWPPLSELTQNNASLLSDWLLETGQGDLVLQTWFSNFYFESLQGKELNTLCWIDSIDAIKWQSNQVYFAGDALRKS